MSSLGKSFGALSATLMNGRGPKLPPLPPGLGLPEKSTIATYREKAGNVATDAQYTTALSKANAYNQSLVNLLNQQPQLTGADRSEIYRYYGDDMANAQLPVYNGLKKKYGGITDFTGQLSQLNPDQFQAQQQQQPAAATPAPVTPVQQAVAAPQTVGPVAKPPEVAPPPTPSVATSDGNIAGKTTTTGAGASKGARRGRFATLLTGLGGAVERFGL